MPNALSDRVADTMRCNMAQMMSRYANNVDEVVPSRPPNPAALCRGLYRLD